MLRQANSFYDALQIDVTKRVTHGAGNHATYTCGKSDTLSATMADDAFPNGLLNPPFFGSANDPPADFLTSMWARSW